MNGQSTKFDLNSNSTFLTGSSNEILQFSEHNEKKENRKLNVKDNTENNFRQQITPKTMLDLDFL